MARHKPALANNTELLLLLDTADESVSEDYLTPKPSVAPRLSNGSETLRLVPLTTWLRNPCLGSENSIFDEINADDETSTVEITPPLNVLHR